MARTLALVCATALALILASAGGADAGAARRLKQLQCNIHPADVQQFGTVLAKTTQGCAAVNPQDLSTCSNCTCGLLIAFSEAFSDPSFENDPRRTSSNPADVLALFREQLQTCISAYSSSFPDASPVESGLTSCTSLGADGYWNVTAVGTTCLPFLQDLYKLPPLPFPPPSGAPVDNSPPPPGVIAPGPSPVPSPGANPGSPPGGTPAPAPTPAPGTGNPTPTPAPGTSPAPPPSPKSGASLVGAAGVLQLLTAFVAVAFASKLAL